MGENSVISAKVVLLGESGVGKTAISSRYIADTFTPDLPQTVGASFLTKQVTVNDQVVDLSIWDTAGQEVYRTLTPMYYRDAQMALIIFSVCDEVSFNSINEWVEQVKSMSTEVVIVVCGNKTDMTDQRVISFDKAVKLSEQLHVPYIETSAMTGNGVDIAFETMVQAYLNQINKTHKTNMKRVGTVDVVADATDDPKEKKKCC